MFPIILFSAIGGGCLIWGFARRSAAKARYWQMLNEAAEKGTQSEDRPYIEAHLSSARGTANAVIIVGLIMTLCWFI